MDHTRFRAAFVFLLTLLALGTRSISAQRGGYSYISYVGSEVSLVSKSEEDSTARINMPIGAGDKLATGRSSRAETILADGNIVRFDSKTDVRFDRLARTHETDDDRDLVFLQSGALSIEVRNDTNDEQAIRVDTDDATIVLAERGVFRIDVGRRGTEVYALSGSAQILGRTGQAVVHSGEYGYVTGSETIEVEPGELPNDRFTRFIEERRIRPRQERGNGGARYVAEAGAAEYDYDYDESGMEDSGTWDYVESLGRTCWRPRVGADWRPYSLGYWRSSPCGLTWVSYEQWGWLPYHYGTWTQDAAFGWCWLPGASYSPAWVYWNYTSSYLGWCPVGYYGYYDNYYRSTRTWFGDGRGLSYPHLRGAVDVTQVNGGGWNYAQIPAIGTRMAGRDVIRGDRMAFRPGEVGMIATAPLRLDRSGQPRSSIQEAVRRVPISEGIGSGTRRLPVNAGLTSILRRQDGLTQAGQTELRRSIVQVGRDAGYHSVSADQLASGRRTDISTGSGTPVSAPASGDSDRRRIQTSGGNGRLVDPVAPRSSWRESLRRTSDVTPGGETPLRQDGSFTGRGSRGEPARPGSRTDEGWRSRSSSSTPRSVESSREQSTATPRRDDGGWRSPHADNPRSRDESPRRETAVPRGESPRPEPRRETPSSHPRSYEAPRREAPPAPRYEAPRREAAPSPRYEAPAPRSEPPRSEPPRSAPPSPPSSEPQRRG